MGRVVEVNIPKSGSKWAGNDGDVFRVIDVVELDNHTWIHYIKVDNTHREYSCYVDSFLARFRELPE